MTKDLLLYVGRMFIEAAEGKTLQQKNDDGVWEDLCFDTFDYIGIDYSSPTTLRIKRDPIFTLFARSDYVLFMDKKVRRKGDKFKDEIWYVTGIDFELCQVSIEIEDCGINSSWKQFTTLFEEWEFEDGTPFGKLIS